MEQYNPNQPQINPRNPNTPTPPGRTTISPVPRSSPIRRSRASRKAGV